MLCNIIFTPNNYFIFLFKPFGTCVKKKMIIWYLYTLINSNNWFKCILNYTINIFLGILEIADNITIISIIVYLLCIIPNLNTTLIYLLSIKIYKNKKSIYTLMLNETPTKILFWLYWNIRSISLRLLDFYNTFYKIPYILPNLLFILLSRTLLP